MSVVPPFDLRGFDSRLIKNLQEKY